jgi:hypothetical protein
MPGADASSISPATCLTRPPSSKGAYVSDEGLEVVSALDAAVVMTLGQIALHMGDDALTRNAVAIARKMIATGVPEVQRLASWLLAL